MKLTEKEVEAIGRCAEKNALDCKFDQEHLCRHCSVWKNINQLVHKQDIKELGVIQLLTIIRCAECRREVILKFDVNLCQLRIRDLPNSGWQQNEDKLWVCPDCLQ
jgi:superfamily II helicase